MRCDLTSLSTNPFSLPFGFPIDGSCVFLNLNLNKGRDVNFLARSRSSWIENRSLYFEPIYSYYTNGSFQPREQVANGHWQKKKLATVYTTRQK